MNFPDQKIVDRIRREFPAGCRVELLQMDDVLSRILDNLSYQDL